MPPQPAARAIWLAIGAGTRRLTWAVAVACACAGDRAPSGDLDAVRSDSAGIEIVTNRGSPASLPAWSLELLLDIGGDLDDPDQQLFGVVDAALLSDGRIVAANAGMHELRYFAPDGALERSVGGEGEGPGEFRLLSFVDVAPDDSVFVSDPRQRRVSVFTSAGDFARHFSLVPPNEGALPRYLARFADGRIAASLFNVVSPQEIEDGRVLRGDATYLVYAADGTGAQTVGTLPSLPSYVRMFRTRGQLSAVGIESIPFATGARAAFGPQGFALGTGDAYEIRVHGRDATLRRLIRWPGERAVVTPELIEALVRERAGETEDPEARREARESLSDLPLPERLPAYDDLSLDRLGYVWAREPLRPGETRVRWTVFDTSGAMSARVELPRDFTAYEIGADHVLGRFEDELGVEHVQLHRLRRSPGG